MGSCLSSTDAADHQAEASVKKAHSVATTSGSVEGNASPTPNEKLVEAYLHNTNCTNGIDNLANYCHSDAIFNFRDSEAEMNCMDIAESALQVGESLPDLVFRWDSVEEISPGKVIIKNFRFSGTHTGKPYAFGPYPAIEPTGKTFEDPPQEI